MMKDGWVSGLESSLPDAIITNVSLGSTGIFNLIDVCLRMKEELSSFDHIIVEHLINDISFFMKRRKYYFSLLHELYSPLVALGVPITLMAARRYKLSAPQIEFMADTVKFLKVLGVNVYDVFGFLEKVRQSRGIRSISELYRDSAHPLPDVAVDVGKDLSRVLMYKSSVVQEELSIPFFVLNGLWLRNNSDSVRSRRISNSLVDVVSIVIKAEERVTFEIPEALQGSRLVGFFFNASRSYGYCSFSSKERKVTKLLSSNLSGRPSDVIWARPVHGEIILGENFSLDVISLGREFEETEFCQREIDIPGFQAELELVSLVFSCH